MIAYRRCAKPPENRTVVPVGPKEAQEVGDRCAGSAELPLRGLKNYEVAEVSLENRLHSLKNQQFRALNIDFHQLHSAQLMVLMIVVKAGSRHLERASVRRHSSNDTEGSIDPGEDPKQSSGPWSVRKRAPLHEDIPVWVQIHIALEMLPSDWAGLECHDSSGGTYEVSSEQREPAYVCPHVYESVSRRQETP